MEIFINKHVTLLISLFLLFAGSNSLKLSQTGYYSLVLAIDESTVQSSVENYVENIKEGFQDLSNLLNFTTSGKFSIRNVDILVPTHWTNLTYEPATHEFYEEADVKISHKYSYPNTNNPNPCGFPGNNILLPYNFFDSARNGTFGRHGKSLLAQFVRLRYGAWEEHGYPGDSQFPYYWKPLQGEEWEVNACSDKPIVGVYRNIDNDTECGADPEDVEHLYPPPFNCRFIPNDAQEATSSLMSYHYLPTIDRFCDFKTHNRMAPTPQNFYCRYQSVLEVITSSPDWIWVTGGQLSGQVEFRVVKNTESPLLHVLIDGGKSQAPDSILSEISSQLLTVMSNPQRRNTVGSLSLFPARNSDPYEILVPWSTLGNKLNEFEQGLKTGFGSQSGLRNFPKTLKAAVDDIKRRRHAEGGVILIIKTGPETNLADTIPENLILSALVAESIKVFAIEIQGSVIQPGIVLERFISQSGGKHLAIRNANDLQQPLMDFMNALAETLDTKIQSDTNYELALKKVIRQNDPVFIPTKGINRILVYLIPLTGEISEPVFADLEDFDSLSIDGTMDSNWGQTGPDSTRIWYREVENLGGINTVKWERFEYECTENCEVLVIILVEASSEDNPGDDNMKVVVSTSAIDNLVNFDYANAKSGIGSPFAIYARIHEDEVPLRNAEGLNVIAFVYDAARTGVWEVRLKDDGSAVPDISINDGIFSGTFVPKDDGVYTIIVTVDYAIPVPPEITTSSSTTEDSVYLEDDLFGEKLLPVDQQYIACGSGYLGCFSKLPELDFVISQELLNPIEFINRNNLWPFAWRITDFKVIPIGQTQISFEWTEPGVYTNVLNRPDTYEIHHKDDFEMLLSNFSDCEYIPSILLPYPGLAGGRVTFNYTFNREETRYFGIRARSSSTPDWLVTEPITSVIVGIKIVENVVVTTTTTFSPTTTITSTTTSRPTVETTPTTDAPETTTSVFTRTTSEKTTTERPTTESTTITKMSTTTPEPTTIKPVKYWYQQKEGVITLSVFGGAVGLLMFGGAFYIWITRYR